MASVARACPICGQPTVTLSERYARAEAALLVEWVSAKTSSVESADSTTYEIAQVQRAAAGAFKKGERLTLDGYHAGKRGSLVFLLGNKTEAGTIKWDYPPIDVTETSFQYIVQAPSPETSRTRRLEYFVRFLEYPDSMIANDAFAEFVNAPAADIFAITDKLPREKIRRWLLDEKLPNLRQAGYGLMLGLCGDKSDAALLEKRILDDSDEQRRFGIEGVMVGYLLLTGEKGLERLEATRIRNSLEDPGEAFPAIVAIRYFWTYGNDRIPRNRLQRAMRLLLDNPTFTESVIKDLGRWKDWGVMADVMRLYSLPDYNDQSIKTAIISFMIAATKDVPPDTPKETKPEQPPHVAQAVKYLGELSAKDPKLVRHAEKAFFLQ
jgi:hypothetical protein